MTQRQRSARRTFILRFLHIPQPVLDLPELPIGVNGLVLDISDDAFQDYDGRLNIGVRWS